MPSLKQALKHVDKVVREGIRAWASDEPGPSFEEMISALSSYMKQFREQDGEDPSVMLSMEFKIKTKSAGSFDRARISVLSMLSSLQKAAEQVRKEEDVHSRLIDLAIVSASSSLADLDYISLVRNRLADPSWVKWHLSAALVDARRLLEYHMFTPEEEATLRTWKEAILELQALLNEQPIMGCYILERCLECCGGETRPEPRHVLLTRLAEDPAHLFRTALHAAHVLYRYKNNPELDQNAVDAGETSQQADNRSTDNVTPPPGFLPHCVSATKGRIRRALHHAEGHADTHQTLEQLEHVGAIAIVRPAKGNYILVYFKDETTSIRVRNWLKDNPEAKKKPRGPQAKRKRDTQEPG
jgi:hypothetical protein